MSRAYLGLGTNLGERMDNLKNATEKITELIGSVIRSSYVYETDPWGFASENKFLNMVVEVKTSLKPSGLLGRIMMIETLMGRTREGIEYKSRIIDIDILFYENHIINNKALQVPHPGIPDRRFVLVPLCEIAPKLIHPIMKKSVTELLSECKDKSEIIRVSFS